MNPNDMTATEQATCIAGKEMSVTELVQAHIGRINEVNGRLNAVIWPLFDQALDQAAEADRLLGRGEASGALFGVPVTVKDQFLVDGTPTSLGLAHRSTQVLRGEGPLVQRLREQGAIIVGKTSLPQLLLTHECEHGHYGHCRNPFDLSRVPGGSSGGEASIIAAGGAALGLGGDMGGSIRIPASESD
jgi:fatty acid amide hydrolase